MYLKKFFVFAGAAAVLMGMSPLNAEARSILGITAIGVNAADRACFSTDWMAVINTCSTTQLYNIPMVVDSPGTHTFTITASGPSVNSNVGCSAVGMDSGMTSYWTSGNRVYLPSFGTAQNLVASVYAPNNGGYFMSCLIGPGAQVNVVNY